MMPEFPSHFVNGFFFNHLVLVSCWYFHKSIKLNRFMAILVVLGLISPEMTKMCIPLFFSKNLSRHPKYILTKFYYISEKKYTYAKKGFLLHSNHFI